MRTIYLTKIISLPSDCELRTFDDADEEKTTPVAVNIDAIRCYYPRRDDKPGTHIRFVDGGGFAVTEPFAEIGPRIIAAINAARL